MRPGLLGMLILMNTFVLTHLDDRSRLSTVCWINWFEEVFGYFWVSGRFTPPLPPHLSFLRDDGLLSER